LRITDFMISILFKLILQQDVPTPIPRIVPTLPLLKLIKIFNLLSHPKIIGSTKMLRTLRTPSIHGKIRNLTIRYVVNQVTQLSTVDTVNKNPISANKSQFSTPDGSDSTSSILGTSSTIKDPLWYLSSHH